MPGCIPLMLRGKVIESFLVFEVVILFLLFAVCISCAADSCALLEVFGVQCPSPFVFVLGLLSESPGATLKKKSDHSTSAARACLV